MTGTNLYPVSELSDLRDKTNNESLLIDRLLEPFKTSKINNILRDKRSTIPSKLLTSNVMSNFKSLLQNIRKFSGITKEPSNALKRVLDSSNLGISVADNAFKNLKITKDVSTDFLKVNDVFVHQFESFLRSGDLAQLLRLAERDVAVSAVDKKLFSDLARDYPEKVLRDIDEVSNITKLERPQLNITLNNIDKLSNASLKELGHFRRNWGKYVGTGTVALVIGTVALTDNWFKDALAARRGCWMVKTVNGKATSCRVSRFTCGDLQQSSNNTPGGVLCNEGDTNEFYNTTLYFMYIVSLSDDDRMKLEMARHLDVRVEDLEKETSNLIKNKYTIIDSVVSQNRSQIPLLGKSIICDLKHPEFENGEIPYCRMCDSTVDPKSTRFIDPKQLADNVTFKCVSDPSLVDLLTDMAISTGQNLWDGITSVSASIFKYAKYIAVVAIIVALVIAIYFIFSKFVLNRTSFKARDSVEMTQPLI